jgi:pimeloyl-ACP methyl ester carboxylesterase
MLQVCHFQNSRSLNIVADHYRIESDAVVVLVHGYTSNRRWRGRFPYIAQSLNLAGFSAFAFDHAGCGESDDDSLSLTKHVQDVLDAVEHVRSLGYQRVAKRGHSLGARSCIEANPIGVLTMVLSGAATAPMHYHWPDYYSAGELAELATNGSMRVPAKCGMRAHQVIEAQMLRDFAEINQQAVLSALGCPVLIINGNHPDDTEECALLAGNLAGLQWLPAGSHHVVIEGARHSFEQHLEPLTRTGVEWTMRNMTKA